MCKMYLCGFVGALIPGWNGRVFDESVVAGRRSIYPPVRFLLAATRGQCSNNFIIFSNIHYLSILDTLYLGCNTWTMIK